MPTIKSGAKAGKSTQELVLKEPDWVQFFMGKAPQGSIPAAIKSHVAAFNSRPLVKECWRCKDLATRASFYAGDARSACYWCEGCDPYSTGARSGMLTIVTTYSQALRFVDFHCRGSRVEKRKIIRLLGAAKGLPGRVGPKEAADFLA